MKRTFLAAFVLASICACYGSTIGDTDLLGPDGGGGVIPGDGGTDGGDGGSDAGTTDAGPDAGCVAKSLSGLAVVDSCPGPQSVSAVAELSIAGPPGCGVTISLTSGNTPCTGAASNGSLDAFDGGCAGLPSYTCTAPSLPGTLTCTYLASTCTIRICDAGTCGP
jgi:hypothetical protein